MSLDEIRESSSESMTDAAIRDLLVERGVGVLGLQDEDVPYLLPMSFGYDGDDSLYFLYLLFGSESHKESLSERNGRARFLVFVADSVHEWRSVSLVGRLEGVDEDEWPHLRDAMENAWHPDLFSAANPTRGVEGYRFRIDDWTGIHHTR